MRWALLAFGLAGNFAFALLGSRFGFRLDSGVFGVVYASVLLAAALVLHARGRNRSLRNAAVGLMMGSWMWPPFGSLVLLMTQAHLDSEAPRAVGPARSWYARPPSWYRALAALQFLIALLAIWPRPSNCHIPALSMLIGVPALAWRARRRPLVTLDANTLICTPWIGIPASARRDELITFAVNGRDIRLKTLTGATLHLPRFLLGPAACAEIIAALRTSPADPVRASAV